MAAALKGVNQIQTFRPVAEALASSFASYDGVTGIVFLGALVRGFADQTSDLDITVVLRHRDETLRRQLRQLALDAARSSDVADVDLIITCLDDFAQRDWDEGEKWEYSKAAEVVFDPSGAVKAIIRKKLAVPQTFWIQRIVCCATYLTWYCCPPHEAWVFTRDRLGIPSTIAESWVDRGDMVAAHYCLHYGMDLILQLVFALNREYVPVPKWRLHYSYALNWLPNDYPALLKTVLSTKSFSVKELHRKLDAIQKLWADIRLKIEDDFQLTPQQITDYYVHHILHQRPLTSEPQRLS